jgi:hypothetical protein
MDAKITIISPTTGKNGLNKLIESLKRQTVPYTHILLWDDKREDAFLYPDEVCLSTKNPYDLNCNNGNITYSIVVPGSVVQGVAAGSALRSIGLLAATTPFVTFGDDDVWYEEGHLESLLKAVDGKQWAYCKRKIWASDKDYIGIDDFESVGDSPSRKVPYEMVDNNTMIFARRLGTSAAVIYREVQEYNDDRQMYAFLKQYGGSPGKTDRATVNQICPKRLETMFRNGCTKE